MNIEIVNELIIISEEVNVYRDTDENSEVLCTYPSGNAVFVSGRTDNGWLQVYYQGNVGFIKDSAQYEVFTIDEAELEEELNKVNEDLDMVQESIEVYQNTRRSTAIWISVIVLIVLAIAGITLYEIKKRKNLIGSDGEKEEDSNLIPDDSTDSEVSENEEKLDIPEVKCNKDESDINEDENVDDESDNKSDSDEEESAIPDSEETELETVVTEDDDYAETDAVISVDEIDEEVIDTFDHELEELLTIVETENSEEGVEIENNQNGNDIDANSDELPNISNELEFFDLDAEISDIEDSEFENMGSKAIDD